MSKNMTRTGLAFGAGISLVATSFAALPANAVGIDNDYVALADTEEYGNYNMLTTGYIDLDGSFAFAAESGGELKFYVEDPNEITVFDVAPENVTDTTTLSGNEAIYRIAALNDSEGDLVTVSHDANKTPHNVVVGDVIEIDEFDDDDVDFKDDILSSINTLQQVTAVSALDETVPAATASTLVVGVASSGDGDKEAVEVKVVDADGIHVGAIIELTGAAADLINPNDSDNPIGTDPSGEYVVEAVDDANDTVTVSIELGADADKTFDLGSTDTLDVDSNSITFVPETEITTSVIQPQAGGTDAGDVIEVTDGEALDDLDEIREGAFGAAGVVGVATTRSTASATDGNYVIDTNEENTSQGDQVARVATISDSTDGSVNVTAWIDNDDDGVIDSTEYVSPTRTINFVKPASVTYTVTAGDLFVGTGQGIEGRVTADLNLDEVGTQGLLDINSVLIDASAGAEDPSAEGAQQLGYDSVNKWLDAAITLDFSVAVNDSVRLTVEDGGTQLGASATFGVGALTVAGSTMAVNASADNTEASQKDADGDSASGITVKVRKGAGAVTATYTAFNDDPTDTTADKVVPNVPVTATVTSTNVTAADGVKVNDKVVDGGTETIVGTTNSAGQYVINLTETAADASDSVAVSLNVQGKNDSGKVTFNFESTSYSVYNVAGNPGSSTEYNQKLVVGGSLTQTYWVADQFGQTPNNGDTAVTVTRSGSSRTAEASWSYNAAVVDGLATVTITDDGTGLGNDTVDVKVFDVLSGGGLAGTADDANTYTLTYESSSADYTPAAVTAKFSHDGVDDTATDDQPILLETTDLYSYDTRGAMGKNAPTVAANNVDTNSPADGTADAQLTLTGAVTNAAGGAVAAGLPVTISIPGAFMIYTTGDSETVYGLGSITVSTDATGNYSVDVHASQGGSKTATVTAGTATATDDVTFAGNSVGADLTLTLPAAVEASSSFQVTANLTDEFGDGADTAAGSMKVTYSGPGIYFGSLPTETDANGDLSFSVLLGANDSGTISVTVSYDENGDGDYTDADDLTVTKSLVVGQSADQKVNAGSFKGYVAVYAKGYAGSRLSAKIGNDWVIVPSLASNFERVTDFTGAGVDIAVRIYIDRVLVDTIPLTTK